MRLFTISSRQGCSSLLIPFSVAITIMAAPSAAIADWIVTRDGASFEIDGGWQTSGELVTFSLPNGTYSAMRISSVDLDASKALTSEKASASMTEKQPEAKRRATIVITDADVHNPPMQPLESLNPDEAQGEEAAKVESETTSAEALEITEWQEQVDVSSASLEIHGTVTNTGANPATTIAIRVVLYDDEGTLLTRSSARLDRPVLLPGESSRFVAKISDVLSFDSADFEIDSRGFVNHPSKG